jgi:hypothetical protein
MDQSSIAISEAGQQAESATRTRVGESRAARRARKARKPKASASGPRRAPLPRSETSYGRGGGHIDDGGAYLPTADEIAAEAARQRDKHLAAKLAEASPLHPPPGRLATLAPLCTAGLHDVLRSSRIRLAK